MTTTHEAPHAPAPGVAVDEASGSRAARGERTGVADLLVYQAAAWADRLGIPFAIRATIDRGLSLIAATIQLAGCERQGRVFTFTRLDVRAKGRIVIGNNVQFFGGTVPTRLHCAKNATLSIGAESAFNYGVTLDAQERVEIGARCLFGSRVRIADRTADRSGPIVIGDGVWVAHGVTILPGVRIGDGSVISAGSLVTEDVPPDSLAAGTPARTMSLNALHNAPAG